ncbi:MAG: PDZ domain-containing protein, partial [Pseudomonadota bacterium]|nr:PDZ domain-containing protein [Pseudomonadota bacterium]
LPAMPVQLGVDLYEEAGKVKIRFCYEGEAAMEAGLSAGDELLSINGQRMSLQQLEALCKRSAPGESLSIQAVRRQRVISVTLQLQAPTEDWTMLMVHDEQNSAQKGWLNLQDNA